MDIQLTFAVPQGGLFAPLAAHAGSSHRIITAASERECASLLLNHRVDAALISPLHYGLAATKVDYRIVPASCVFLDGYTDVGAIWFAPGLGEIRRCVSASPDDFLVAAARMLLAERYGLHPEIIPAGRDELMRVFLREGCAVGYAGDIPAASSLDISEDWLDSFEVHLPLAVWACRQDDDLPADLPDIISSLAAEGLPDETPVGEHFCDNPDHHHDGEREGIIRWRWNAGAVGALETTLDLLFYHQLVPVIPEAKFWKNG